MIRLWLFIAALFCASSAYAHEIRPAFLKITEQESAQFDVMWKQPVLSGRRLKIQPVFPEDCQAGPADRQLLPSSVTQTYRLECSLLEGEISIAGLGQTITDVFVEIHYLSGERKTALLKPNAPTIDLTEDASVGTSAYFVLGVEHIVFGWDHLLFVIGLVLLIGRSQVFWVITSFTLAHSLTLALASLGLINIPIRPVEILIAMSVVLLAVEVINKQAGRETFTARNPHIVSFAIGLIHGCGFASALADIGLPKGMEIFALLLFNVGVEIGQIAVIIAFLCGLTVMKRINLKLFTLSRISLAYMIGGIAVFWMLQRLSQYLTA